MTWNFYTSLFLALFALHRGFELVLDCLQRRHLARRGNKVPRHLEGKVDAETIGKAVAYNLDKLWLGMLSSVLDALVIWVMIGFGFSWLDDAVRRLATGELLFGLAFFALIGLGSAIVGLPLEVVSVFVIEERHGFNRQSPLGFAVDKLKGLLVSAALGGLLLLAVLALMAEGGDLWWLFAFFAVASLQLLAAWLYPVAIMPLFNKFTPAPPDLAEDIGALARRVGFPLKRVFSMDGSRRSAHSNAFIVGLWGARKIVLFDTLMSQLSRRALIAVLAHELGHFKLGHLTRRLAFTAVLLFGMFFALGYMRDVETLYRGLGFERVSGHAAIIVFSLLISEAAAPFGWLLRAWSRLDERAADRFAVESTESGGDLKDALIALGKENLSSPGSHRLYRSYYNSHPALGHRLKAIEAHAESLGFPLSSEAASRDDES